MNFASNQLQRLGFALLFVCAAASGQGIIETFAGGAPLTGVGDGGPATSAVIFPLGVAVDAFGNIFIADAGGNRIRKLVHDVRNCHNCRGERNFGPTNRRLPG